MTNWHEVQAIVKLLQRRIDEVATHHDTLYKEHHDVEKALYSICEDSQQPCVQHPGDRIRALGARLELAEGLLTEAICWISKDNTLTYGKVAAELHKRLEEQRATDKIVKNSHQP